MCCRSPASPSDGDISAPRQLSRRWSRAAAACARTSLSALNRTRARLLRPTPPRARRTESTTWWPAGLVGLLRRLRRSQARGAPRPESSSAWNRRRSAGSSNDSWSRRAGTATWSYAAGGEHRLGEHLVRARSETSDADEPRNAAHPGGRLSCPPHVLQRRRGNNLVPRSPTKGSRTPEHAPRRAASAVTRSGWRISSRSSRRRSPPMCPARIHGGRGRIVFNESSSASWRRSW